ncbi:LrgB family protein [uncultured Chloroflexus sp.]|uniref:LrgB family protein n=1 Tax=uncultured Chloroflexus sp. TaxID=214040 RepID=UPI00261504FF|nr:LrgB family protein [uncultured Chloroflexus sp.]
MDERIFSIWVYLAQTPLLWLTATIAIYRVMVEISRRLGSPPLLNPVLLAIITIVTILMATDTPYATYFDGAQFVHFLLGPATVALAIPLYESERALRRIFWPALAGLLIGSATGIAAAVLIGRLAGLSNVTLRSLAPKSITTPIAMGIAEQLGGLPSLTAVIVIVTGMVGALFGWELLGLMGVRDDSERGFALGLASHGLGTARSLQFSSEAGALAGLAMGLNGAMTSLLAPFLARWLGL